MIGHRPSPGAPWQTPYPRWPQPPIGSVAMYMGAIDGVRNTPNEAWKEANCFQESQVDGEDRRARASTAVAAAPDETGPMALIEAQGWMVCDGRQLRRSGYPALYAAIGDIYGPAQAGWFRLPDLRGAFLRGVDAGAGVDPDAGNRHSPDGSATASGVGSIQCDAFQVHQHHYEKAVAAGLSATGSAVYGLTQPEATVNPTTGRVSTETRPRNVAVHYIIRYQ
ncbi:MAG: phage tail protein [Xanthomonadaceae bacterium]|nr:phage tail protein [Xanthomonadaceae bacterium]